MAEESLQAVDDGSQDWLKERHERLMLELATLLADVPDQGAADALEEMIARVRWATEHLRAKQDSTVPP